MFCVRVALHVFACTHAFAYVLCVYEFVHPFINIYIDVFTCIYVCNTVLKELIETIYSISLSDQVKEERVNLAGM